MTETELAPPVVAYLKQQGYQVRSEVNHCDITAVSGEQVVVVELKRSLSLQLLAQGVERQRYADLVYLAVPRPEQGYGKRFKGITHLLRRLELGLLLISGEGVEVAVQPRPFDRSRSRQTSKKKRARLLGEIRGRSLDANTGGSTGKELMTAYREKVIQVATYLEERGPLTPAALRSLGTDPKKTTSILYDNHYGWFERVQRGLYALNDKGRAALKTHAVIASRYRGEDRSLNKTTP